MNSLVEHGSDSVVGLLGHVRRKGVRLWSENGELRYRAPRGALSPAEIEVLVRSKHEIILVLERAAAAEGTKPRVTRRSHADRAPLSYSQLSHWYQHELWRRPSHRQIATAIRIHGALDHQALRQGLAEILRCQEALRTQIVVEDGTPVQSICKPDPELVDSVLRIEDLRAVPQADREAEVMRHIEACIIEPVDLGVEPLLGVRLLQLELHEHVVILTLEHMISDMYSLNILRRDLFSAYGQAASGLPIALPPVSVRFADHASWLRDNERAWRQSHESYWRKRLDGVSPIRFPEDTEAPTRVGVAGWDTVNFRIDVEHRAQLRQWCQQHGTTLVMAVFTAYVALLFRWCGQSAGIVRYQTDGRTDAEWANTIGYFAMPLCLRLELRDDDSFLDLTRRVVDEYCNASQHADSCYLEARWPRPDFAGSSAFNWWPSPAPDESNHGDDGALSLAMVPFVHPLLRTLELTAEPAIVLAESLDGIDGALHFSKRRFAGATMQRFARNLQGFIEALLRQPQAKISEVTLV